MLKSIISLALKLLLEDKSGINPLNNIDTRKIKYST